MRFFVLAIMCLLMYPAFGQENQDILFTVGGDEVSLGEFKYIYEKNNADKADYTKESVEEYLELYKKFKLKVKRAKELGLDTVKILQDELAGYRKQLAKSYLKDKEISERLITEVMDRMQYDLEVHHIFVSAERKSSADNKQRALDKINNIYEKLVSNKGAGFEEMAKTLSEDKFSASRGGRLGYYTSPLPDGFYEFENVMYSIEQDQFSKPVRSKMGYHILKVTDKRPARGEMEIAHILIRKKNRSQAAAQMLIDSVYTLLEEGRNFETMAAKFSEDIKSKSNGGYIGFFAINQYDASFEDAAFALSKDNAYSEPVETDLGFHIIKRISKRDTSDKDRLRKRIQTRINNHDRFDIAEEKLIETVKNEAGYEENTALLDSFIVKLDESFYSYKWQVPDTGGEDVLFKLAADSYSLQDFAEYCKSNVRERLKFNKSKDLSEACMELYKAFVQDKVMKYEEANLENKYADFRSLMREYREGILLFEITKQEVWDKASSDTAGLRRFFDSGIKKYEWPERVAVYKYSIETDDTGAISVYSFAQRRDHDKLIEKYSKTDQVKISFEEQVLDKNSELLKGMKFEPFSVSKLSTQPKPANFLAFKSLVPPQPKTLEEARGYVIADYQDYLEEQWIESLREKYPVKVNKKVLNAIIKK